MVVREMSSDEKVGTLEEEALKRKERLKNLKRKAPDPSSPKENENQIVLPKPKFRSYKPQDDSLKNNALDNAKPSNIEKEVEDLLAAAKSKVVIEELDIQNLAPRKPDWDLKRDVAKKLEILEKRTQRAIAELIRDRLKQRQEDLASVVSVTTDSNINNDSED